ncbi:MAG: phosphate-starvation-inducible PsiE family protein [Rhodanobacteraceae bacterium]
MPQTRKSQGRLGWREQWLILSYYQRFEAFVAFVLTLVIALVIVVALYRLSSSVVTGLLIGALDPLEQRVFQTVFGEVLTLLIALEFNHTLQYVVRREQSIIQTRVVLLIAMLAVARKLIVFDLHDIEAPEMLGLAAVTIALAGAYWLVRDRDDRAGTKNDDPAE